MNNKELELLVFSEKWQEAVFGHMLMDTSFFLKCRMYIQTNWFRNPRIGTLCKYLYEYYDAYNKHPTVSEFESLKIVTIFDPQERARYQTALNQSMVSSQSINSEVIKKEMTGWIQISKFKDETTAAISRFNQGNFSEAISWLDEKIKDIKIASFDSYNAFDFTKPVDFFKKLIKQQIDGISTGSTLLDKLLAGEGFEKDADGKDIPLPGLPKKFMTVVIGPSNSGKTSLMVTFARHAVANGKKVLYISHEEDEDKVAPKIYKAFLKLTGGGISDLMKDSEGVTKFTLGGMALASRLTYIPYLKTGGMYIEDVISLIKVINSSEKAKYHAHLQARIKKGEKVSEEDKQKTGGFDLVIDDYPAKLISKVMNSRNLEKRERDAYVYSQFQLMANEENLHIIAPVQSNREGFKKSKEGDDFLDMDSISESFGVAMVADQILTINRSDDDKTKNIMHLYVAKSRSNETGSFFWSQVDLAKSLMFDPNLHAGIGKGSYRNTIENHGNMSLLDRIKKEDS